MSLLATAGLLAALQPLGIDLVTGRPISPATAQRNNGPVGNPVARKRRKAERQNRKRGKR